MGINRRQFFVGGAAAAPLVGTALGAGKFRAELAPALKGSRKSAVVTTHEFKGDIEERLDFPGSWDLQIMKMAGHDAPELTPAQILERIRKPVAGRTLAELAAGKKTAVITFDDLTRPTPISAVAPLIVQELKAAGIPEEGIMFMGSFGAHRTLEQDDVAQKLGPRLIGGYTWFNHNCHDSLTELGETKYKNRVYVNRMFLAPQLRITISGVKIHSIAGFGGGAKAVLPGVAGLSTIRYNHNVIGRSNKTVAEGKVLHNDVRLDMIEAARMARVDFSVQVVINGRRRPSEVFAGDIVEAHVAACRASLKIHRTPVAEKADVVVANGYPQNQQATKSLAWIRRSVREGGTGILLMQHPEGMSAWHYLYQPGYSGKGDPLAVLTPKTAKKPAGGHQLIVYSQYIQKAQMSMFPAGAIFARTWNEVVTALLARHKGDSRVAVYPYSTIQHTESELDG